MNYRREIDGLRALAVTAVILFHAGFEQFRGGFVGVDIFFVISGYLITTIIISDLKAGQFSLAQFYERRARRLLPALFVVMFISLISGYFLLMPDDFKRLGQSVTATALFSNNILLLFTSGYWDVDNEFKPLFHTWSLGVEEQFYLIFPLILGTLWRLGLRWIAVALTAAVIFSLGLASWLVRASPDWAFFLLFTRTWQLGLGAISAVYLHHLPAPATHSKGSDILAATGLLLITLSIFLFNRSALSPSYAMLSPTLGAVLLILFCRPDSAMQSVLGNRLIVGLGLISYSLYLWHQPIFALYRSFSMERPDPSEFLLLLPAIIVLSFLTWRFIETPFRRPSILDRRRITILAVTFTGAFAAVGLVVDQYYWQLSPAYDPGLRKEDLDRQLYNERTFSFKKDAFKADSSPRILIIGNSFARDFINIVTENFDISRADIVYRDDFDQCLGLHSGSPLYATADVVVIARRYYNMGCIDGNISRSKADGKKIFYVGTKDFGYNLNWLMHLDNADRRNQFNVISRSIIDTDLVLSRAVPADSFISMLGPTLVDGKVPITDENGRLLSMDGTHLTRAGAIYFGRHAVVNSSFAALFKHPA